MKYDQRTLLDACAANAQRCEVQPELVGHCVKRRRRELEQSGQSSPFLRRLGACVNERSQFEKTQQPTSLGNHLLPSASQELHTSISTRHQIPSISRPAMPPPIVGSEGTPGTLRKGRGQGKERTEGQVRASTQGARGAPGLLLCLLDTPLSGRGGRKVIGGKRRTVLVRSMSIITLA